MKRTALILFLAGLLTITLLIVSRGAGAIWHALAAIGWPGFGLVCLCHLGLIGLMGLSWRVIVPDGATFRQGVFVWARLVRDSGAEILPLSQIGGFVMGARAANLAGVSGAIAAASTIVDVTLELFAQLAFTAIGLVVLLAAKPDAGIALPVATGIGILFAATIAFVMVQLRGLSLVDRIAGHVAGDWVSTGLSLGAIQTGIAAIYDRPARAWLGTILHLLCWFATVAEAWLALRLMGVPIGFGAALAIESLLYAVRSVAFAVPNAVGVQEGAYLVLGGIFGLAPETVLALSLLKRARDLTLGVPALLVWQALEARQALRPLPPS
jgi:putative membrane protein